MNRGVLFYPRGPDQVLPVAVIGQARGLVIQNDAGAPNSKVSLVADEVVLKSGDGLVLLATAVNLSGDITKNGPGGLDAGSEAVSTWYYIWLVSNGTDLAVLFSTSFSEINLMFGYDYRALLGAVYNNAAGNFISFYQSDRRQFHAATPYDNTSLTDANGTLIAEAVPPNAKTVFGFIGQSVAGWRERLLDGDGFEAPLLTAQRLYYTGALPVLDLVGFTL